MRTIHGRADLPDDFTQHVPDNEWADAIAHAIVHAIVCVVTGALEAIKAIKAIKVIEALDVIGTIRGATTHRALAWTRSLALALAWAWTRTCI